MRTLSRSALIVATVVALAGCGSSSGPSTKTTSAVPPASTASTPAHTVSTPAYTASTPAYTVSTPAHTSSTKSSPNLGAFTDAGNCLQLGGLGAKFAQAMSAATGGHVDLKAAVSAYNALANAAPSAIRPDLQLIAHAFGSFASALASAHYTVGKVPSASQVSALESAASQLSQPKLRTAEQAIGAWARQNCHA
jgi:predicted small lipoprotein YifL